MADQPDFWRRRGALACLLWPLSQLFRAVAGLRRGLYRRGWLASYRAPVPVVVIGNITVGGSGKTPLVIALAQYLREQGVTCAVVSRGYGGAARTATEVLPESDAAVVGDEPLLIRHSAAVPVFVAPKRADAVKAVLAAYPQTQLVLCDDGMQHYALQRDMEIAVLAADLGIGNGWLLPAGPLREPKSRLSSVDAVVITGRDAAAFEALDGKTYIAISRSSGVRRLHDGERLSWKALVDKQPLFLLTAIARPQRVVDMLQANGMTIADTCFFADHAALDDEAVSAATAFTQDGWLLMTGKDAVKTAAWPAALRERILVLDYQLELPQALLASVAALVEHFDGHKEMS
ncbi:tetraacyldisaccharide 4'-kinase [Cardiobacteriaceae bacterium TAE3-ERU3]|nr:tetraacyldisaccharide 4'-kinase [Cardiobacteriaceae bacterium TAE3-ERU3]